MLGRLLSSALLITLILGFPRIGAQTSTDWHKHYGQPSAERYVLPNSFVLTISYSPIGQTCRLTLESAKPESRQTFDRLLTDLVPPSERGSEIRSIGLSNLVGSTQYSRLTISFYPVSRENNQEFTSAAVSWHGVQCIESDPQPTK